MTREVIIGSTAEWAIIVKPPNRRVWPGARAPPEVMLSLRTRRAIEPFVDGTVELNESTNVGVKTGGSRVGGLELCI